VCVTPTPLPPPDEIKKGNYIMMNTLNTSTTKTLNLFGQQITVKPSTQGKTRLRDYNRPEDTINQRPDPFKKGFYNEYRNDIFIEFIDGEYVLSSGVQGRKKFQSSDTAGIQNTIQAWEKEALHTDGLPSMKGYRTFDEQGSEIKGDLSPVASPLADKPASASSGAETSKPVTFSYGQRQFTLEPGTPVKVVDYKPAQSIKGTKVNPDQYDIYITYNPSDEENPYTISTKGLTSGEYTVGTLDEARAKVDFFKKQIEPKNLKEEPIEDSNQLIKYYTDTSLSPNLYEWLRK
jgi:hypothetical protein